MELNLQNITVLYQSLDRNLSTLRCRFPTFHRMRACFYLTRRSRKGGSQVGDGASGTESASGRGVVPLPRPCSQPGSLLGSLQSRLLILTTTPAINVITISVRTLQKRKTSEPCVALGGRGVGALEGGRGPVSLEQSLLPSQRVQKGSEAPCRCQPVSRVESKGR